MPNSVVKTLTVNGTTYDLKDVDSESYAPKASPALTGTPTAPTASSGTNSTQIATTAFVQDAVSGLSTSLSGLSDTTISSVSNGQVLTYNSTSSKWENSDLSSDVFTVTIISDVDQNDNVIYSIDKTYSEIADAYVNNKLIVCNYFGERCLMVQFLGRGIDDFWGTLSFRDVNDVCYLLIDFPPAEYENVESIHVYEYNKSFLTFSYDNTNDCYYSDTYNWMDVNRLANTFLNPIFSIDGSSYKVLSVNNDNEYLLCNDDNSIDGQFFYLFYFVRYSSQDIHWFLSPIYTSSPSSTAPLMDGTAAIGTSTDYARADHVHPIDAIPITSAEIDAICNLDSVIYSASSPTIGSGQIGSMVVSREIGSIVEGGEVGSATVG